MSEPEYFTPEPNYIEVGGPHPRSWLDRFQTVMSFVVPILTIVMILGFAQVNRDADRRDAEREVDRGKDKYDLRIKSCDAANQRALAFIDVLVEIGTNGRTEPLTPSEDAGRDRLTQFNTDTDAACRASAAGELVP